MVQEDKVTSAGMVPTMLAMLLEYPDLDKYDLSSLTTIGTGGGALPLGLKLKAEAKFPLMRAGSGYGMTETLAEFSVPPSGEIWWIGRRKKLTKLWLKLE